MSYTALLASRCNNTPIEDEKSALARSELADIKISSDWLPPLSIYKTCDKIVQSLLSKTSLLPEDQHFLRKKLLAAAKGCLLSSSTSLSAGRFTPFTMYRYTCPSLISQDPTWIPRLGDLSPCVITHVVKSLIPLILVSTSASILLLTVVIRLWTQFTGRGRRIHLENLQDGSATGHSASNGTLPAKDSREEQRDTEPVSFRRIEDSILQTTVRTSVETSIAAGGKLDIRDTFSEKIRHAVGLLGSLAVLAVELALAAVSSRTHENRIEWERLGLFVYFILLALLPYSPFRRKIGSDTRRPHLLDLPTSHFVVLLYVYLPVQSLVQRSYVLRFTSSIPRDRYNFFLQLTDLIFWLETAITIILAATWLIYSALPYRAALDGVLTGFKAGLGNRAAPASEQENYNPDTSRGLRQNAADARSLFARMFFTHQIPLLIRHYPKSNPLFIKDIPALREDDTPAAAVSTWREAQSRNADRMNTARTAKVNGRTISAGPFDADENGDVPPMQHFAFKLIWHFRSLFFQQAIWCVIGVMGSFVSPLILQRFIQWVEARQDPNRDAPVSTAWFYVVLMAAGQLTYTISYGRALDLGRRICVRMRAICIAEVFSKALRRRDSPQVPTAEEDGQASKNSDEAQSEKKFEKPEAQLVNLVSVDAQYISEIAAYLFYFISCPVAIGIACFLLYQLLGKSAFIGIMTIVLLSPLQYIVSQLLVVTQRRLLLASDARLANASELLNAIRTIKFWGWEERFSDRSMETRERELASLKQRFAVRCGATVLAQATPTIVTVVTFGVHTYVFGEKLDAARAFVALSYFSMIRSPIATVAEMTGAVTSGYVSCQRLESFLNTKETTKYQQLSTPESPDDPTIGFRNATIAHSSKQVTVFSNQSKIDGDSNSTLSAEPEFRLRDIDLEFPEKGLSIIVGPVGSGKTTLLQSLLGENTLLSGKIFVPSDLGDASLLPIDPQTGLRNSIAYCPQTAFLLSATIRDNITFGSPFDQTRYGAVLEACALSRDLEIFDAGDQTIVGERGNNVSGGQKARIALARALYSPAAVILLDDVLSAVDAHTAKHLYKRVLKGPLMAGRTCLLVTHAVGLVMKGAAYAVVLDNGRVTGSGRPFDLLKQGFFEGEELADDGEEITGHPIKQDGEVIVQDTIEAIEDPRQAEIDGNPGPAKPQEPLKKDKFMKAETQETGSVSWRVYGLYLSLMGSPMYLLLVVVAFLGSQYAQMEATIVLRSWVNANHSESKSLLKRSLNLLQMTPTAAVADQSRDTTVHYLTIFCAVQLGFILLIALRTYLLFNGSVHASRTLYKRLLKSVLGARMRFFDQTSTGVILNRFSSDLQTADQQCAEVLMLLAQSVLSSLAVVALVIFATPAFIFPALVVAAIYYGMGQLYNQSNVACKRCDSIARSPVISAFQEAVTGATTLRAYADSARFTRDLLSKLDDSVRAFWQIWQLNRVLAVGSDLAGSIVQIGAAILVIMDPDLDAGAAGLSLSSAATFTDFSLWIVRLSTAAEQSLASVERIEEYLHLEPEEKANSVEPPAHWPSRTAKIEVENLEVTYAPELPTVLKGISFNVEAGQKVGVVGRTGSGKSTLGLAMLRMIEACGGSIKIDGIDISTISLHSLRTRLCIVPQEATLTSGTIRSNLDPFDQYDDAEIWDVLRKCGLASRTTPGPSRATSRAVSRAASIHENSAEANDNGSDSDDQTKAEQEERIVIKSLDEPVVAGGENFSQGQRQLLSLARGLLKTSTSNILIMDESTANLDYRSDQQIQRVLRSSLEGTTVFCVAHRLHTVILMDRILVLDHGQVLEFASPLELLNRPGGAFAELCAKSGEGYMLRRMAEQAEEKRRMAGV